jgi:hypothetical protein
MRSRRPGSRRDRSDGQQSCASGEWHDRSATYAITPIRPVRRSHSGLVASMSRYFTRDGAQLRGWDPVLGADRVANKRTRVRKRNGRVCRLLPRTIGALVVAAVGDRQSREERGAMAPPCASQGDPYGGARGGRRARTMSSRHRRRRRAWGRGWRKRNRAAESSFATDSVSPANRGQGRRDAGRARGFWWDLSPERRRL